MPDGMVREGEWFFGVGVIAWIIVNRELVRIGESFDYQSRMENAIFAHIAFSHLRWGHRVA
jgi:hypothetical protein